jgi:H+/gluconate symporter-like permease
MAGGEDSQPHNPVAPNASSTPTPAPSQAAKDNGFTLQKTGEIMLGFGLSIIFLVIFFVTLHLILKQRRKMGLRKKKRMGKQKQKKATEETRETRETGETPPELHSAIRPVFEAAGTEVVLCELPQDAPPLQELEAGEWSLPIQRPASVLTTTTMTSVMTGTTTSEIEYNPYDTEYGPYEVSPMDPSPHGRHLAAYWAMR